MFTKFVIIFATLLLLVQHLEAKSTLHRSAEDTTKKIKCFNPDKPHDMPDDVYEKYKISSKHLSEKDKKDFWSQFVGWWRNVFAQIGKFFEKVGNFFKNLFSKQKPKPTPAPTTEPPPTPDPNLKKAKNTLICVEYEEDSNKVVTTKVYEVDVTTKADISVTTITTTEATEEPTQAPEMTTRMESKPMPESTPFDPNSDHKEKGPVVIGDDNKVKEEVTDATVVKAV